MSTQRNGANENRHSFEDAKNKVDFQTAIDKKEEQVEKKQAEKAEKRKLREHK